MRTVERKPNPELLIASRNRGKIREIREALSGFGFRFYSLDDFSGAPRIKEDGKTFAENAFKKARYYSKYFGKLTIADDSGLAVDWLKGAPGVFSARYAGENATDRENNRKLLSEIDGVPPSRRGAGFKCVIAVVSPGGREGLVEGSCRGRIAVEEKGKKGFGYDPLFFLPRYGKTMAQISMKEKNRISHRGKALRSLRKVITNFLQ